MPLSGTFPPPISPKRVKTGTITPTTLICSLVVFTALVISAAVIALAVQRRKRQVLRSKEEAEFSSVAADRWEVKREDVDIGTELGKGCFGTVYKGTLKDCKQV